MEQVPLALTWLTFATVSLGVLWELKNVYRSLHTRRQRQRSDPASVRVGVIMTSNSFTAR